MAAVIAPSILSADFARLGADIKDVEAGGAAIIHVDVMDGHFVPNITIGPPVAAAVRRVTQLPVDCHLMVEDPDRWIEAFAEAGADMICSGRATTWWWTLARTSRTSSPRARPPTGSPSASGSNGG